jgi:TolB-like protein
MGVGLACGGVAQAQKKPIRLAVMDFTPAATAPDYAPLGAGLQSMLTTDLGQVSAIVLVERARLRDIEAELKLGGSGLVDKETAAKIGGLAGASHLLVGSFTVAGGKMRLDARLFSVASGEVIVGDKSEGAEGQFFDLEKALVKRIVDGVGVHLNKTQKAELGKPQTQNWQAFQKYSEGLALFDDKKIDAAVAAMQAAVALDPGFTLAAQKLAEFKLALPPPKPPQAEPSCQQNPMTAPSCQPSSPQEGQVPRAPTIFTGDGRTPFGIVVREGGNEAACVTPCQLQLPKGPVEVEVITPTRFKRTLEAPGGPSAIEVTRFNRTNAIIGGVLTGVTAVMIGSTAGLHELSSIDPTSTSASTASQYWPVTLSLAAGLAFPSIYYLMKIGKNNAKITSR